MIKTLESIKNKNRDKGDVGEYNKKSLFFSIILAIGLLIAIVTANVGNLFIFLGLGIASHSNFSLNWDKLMMNVARAFYIIGFFWSFTTGNWAMIAGWSSVFATLFVGTIQ